MIRLHAGVDDGDGLPNAGSAEPISGRHSDQGHALNERRRIELVEIDDGHARICGQRVEFRLRDVYREHRRNIESQQATLKTRTRRGVCGAAEM